MGKLPKLGEVVADRDIGRNGQGIPDGGFTSVPCRCRVCGFHAGSSASSGTCHECSVKDRVGANEIRGIGVLKGHGGSCSWLLRFTQCAYPRTTGLSCLKQLMMEDTD